MEASQKLDTQIDALGLKEATTMATLLKPTKRCISTDYHKKQFKEIQEQIIKKKKIKKQLVKVK